MVTRDEQNQSHDESKVVRVSWGVTKLLAAVLLVPMVLLTIFGIAIIAKSGTYETTRDQRITLRHGTAQTAIGIVASVACIRVILHVGPKDRM